MTSIPVSDDDRLVQGMAWSGDFRVVAAQTTQLVETTRLRADMSPVAAIAIGRAMTGAALMTRLLDKNLSNQYVTLRFDGGGPLGLVLAEATMSGEIRGFVANPRVEQPAIDVGAAVGSVGTLTVVRGAPPAGKPYTSKLQLVSGEVAKDLTYYLAKSEQISSAVLLSVLVGPSGVEAAGGVIIQSFPHASLSAIEAMESQILESDSLANLLGRQPIEDVLQNMLGGMTFKAIDPSFNVPLRFHCPCTRERAFAPLKLFAQDEIDEMIRRDGGAEAVCQFCAASYWFTAEELFDLKPVN